MDAGDLIQERYRLERALGKGGTAEVWLARDERLQRPVAIKLLSPRLADDPEFLVRLFSEAQSIARLSHPNVITVLDYGQAEERPYLVTEYVAAGPLTERTGSPLDPGTALEVIAAAARGAGAAHEIGLVHRDIKPGNILIDESGTPKLADFGIAASLGAENLTATGAAIGSPHYISPEQASGGAASAASDVYSLGVVLYELLSGRKPFEAGNVTALAIAHVEQEPEPPSTHAPQLAPELDDLVMRCLSKDPEARPTDGAALAAEIERLLDPRVVDDDETKVAARVVAARFSRNAGKVAAIVTAAVLLIASFAAWIFTGDSEEPAVATPASKPSGTRSKAPRPTPTPTSTAAAPVVVPSTTPSPSPSKSPDPSPKSGGGGEQNGGNPDEQPSPSPDQDPEPTPSPEPSPSPSPSQSAEPSPSSSPSEPPQEESSG